MEVLELCVYTNTLGGGEKTQKGSVYTDKGEIQSKPIGEIVYTWHQVYLDRLLLKVPL